MGRRGGPRDPTARRTALLGTYLNIGVDGSKSRAAKCTDPYRPRPQRSVWPLLLVSVVVLVVAIVLLLLFLDPAAYLGTTPSGHPGGFYFYGFFPVLLVLFLVMLVVRMVFWSRRWGYRRAAYAHPYPSRDPAIMTVRQRYARGEIRREQYDQLMTELTRRRSGP